jgi:hypothetical protein
VKAVQVAEAKVETGAMVTVMFDDETTNVGALVSATANVGFPARVKN